MLTSPVSRCRLCASALVMFACLVSLDAYAEPGFKVGINIWSQDLSGTVEYQGDPADIENDFDITEPADSIKLYFETRDLFPFYPDFRFYYNSFRYEGQTSEIYDFGAQPFGENAKVIIGSETFGLIAFYKKSFTHFLEGSAGLDIRNVSFDVTLSGFNASTKSDTEVIFSGTKELVSFIPMLFFKIRINLPDTDIYAYAEGNYAKLGDNTLADYRAALGTEVFWAVNMEAGFRQLSYMVRNSTKDINIALDVSGSFIELNYDF